MNPQAETQPAEIEVSQDRIQLMPGSPVLHSPYYTDATRARIRALAHMPDGAYKEIEGAVSETATPFIRDVFAQYSLAEIEMFTHRARIIAEKREQLGRQAAEDKRIEDERRQTFEAKEKALNMPELKACGDEELMKKIRRARSAFEVLAWTSVALAKREN